MIKGLFFAFLLFVFLPLFISCELDYSLGFDEGETLSYPDVTMKKVEQMEIQGDQVFVVEADLMEVFYDIGETRFNHVQFEERDQDKRVLREGSAGLITQFDNDDLQLKDGIDIRDLEGDSRVQGDDLFWIDSERSLSSSSGETISLLWEGNLSIQGKGFFADFQRNEVRFSESVEGTLRDDEGEVQE